MKKKPAFQSVRRTFSEGGFFKLRVVFSVLLCFAGVTIVLFALGKASAQPRRSAGQPGRSTGGIAVANKIAPWVMEHTANGQQAEFFVVLADQADLRPAAALGTKAEKGRFVYRALWNKAQTTQGPILQLLRDGGIEHQSFYIINAILVKGTRQIAEALAIRPDVARVEGNPVIHNDLPEAVQAPIQPAAPAIEPGITYTHAPQVWALGFTGQQIVVASADTGVRWTHNALKPHYRGWDGMVANHDYNWHDSIHNSSGNPCGNDSAFPCDDFFHGSHTTGTAIGDDGMGNQIGMAPGAKWIGCRNMDVGDGTPARYIECMQWFLAPTRIGGGDPDPTKAPDITINSWGCPASEGCTLGNELQAAVEAQEAAGIQMVVAAGNSGSACSTVSDPPSFYLASYTAGALNTGTDTIAGFSSRGPVTRDGSGRIKPDIAAPGTSTRSASNSGDADYAIASGTSMATPHIAGAMALLWSANPALRHQITASRDAVNNTAVHIASTLCGTAGPPNNVYGWGRVDILAAVQGPGPTPTATPTATPTQCSWSAGPVLPSVGARFVGVFFPANGKFYVMGGRSADTQGSEFTHPFEYDPVSNSWTTKAATYPDTITNNMACGVLNDSGTDYIYCAGGSQVVTNLVTGRVFRYNPIPDVITAVAGDWPPGVNTLPGGFSVSNNKLYILGGFNTPPTGNSTDQIWQFTPNPVGWVQKSAVLPVPLSYVPAATISGMIYTGGGASITAGVLTPTTNSFRYDPTADSISTIVSIPRPTDNTRGFNFCNQLWVPGGDDTTFPNPSNQVNVYDPVANSWSLGQPMSAARRNFATDTDGTSNVWVAGGYEPAAPGADVEIFHCPVSPCGSPTPTPTATATATATATPTATAVPRSTPTPRPRPTPPPRP